MIYLGSGGAVGSGNDLLDPGLHDDPIFGDPPAGMTTVFRLGGVATTDYGTCQPALTSSDNVSVSATQASGYATSLKFDGDWTFNSRRAYLRYTNSACIQPRTADFSIAQRVWINSSSTRILLWGNYVTSAATGTSDLFRVIYAYPAQRIDMWVNGVSVGWAGNLGTNQWGTWEIRRVGNTITLYINGSSVATYDATGKDFQGSATAGIGYITSENNEQNFYVAATRIAIA